MSLLNDFKNYSSHEWRGMKPGLERVEIACEKLGHPERQFPSLHIAGSNGKGSVAAMLHSILSQAGYTVGLFTSPHLVRVNERFRLGEEEISDGELEGILKKIEAGSWKPEAGSRIEKALLPVSGLRPLASFFDLSFFELCTLIAFLYFAEKKVDIAILEVGLGGRLDATNVIIPRVSVITEISLEHTEILGPDLKSIAREKAGIIKPQVPVVCGATVEEARVVIEEVAKERGAEVVWVGSQESGVRSQEGRESRFDWGAYQNLEVGLEGLHQFHNAAIALTTLDVFKNSVGAYGRTPLLVDETSIRRGLANVRWPGRMEWVSRHPPILFDGAHNPAGMRGLVESLRSQEPGVRSQEEKGIRWKVLFSAAKEKDVPEMLSTLQEIASEITICRMENTRSIDPTSVVGTIRESPLREILREGADAFETYQKLVTELKEDEGLLVTGSLFLVGELKRGLARPTSG